MSVTLQHAFTVDLEDWFCSHNLSAVAPYPKWDRLPSRIEANTDYALSLLSRHDVKATFFVLGWIAERHPELIAAIAQEGHEIATHGFAHQLVTGLSPESFEADVRRSLEVLHGVVPGAVAGYRAPAFSLTDDMCWAFDALARCGLRYDSSLYPVALHPDYGAPTAPLRPYRHANGLVEVPLSCAPLGVGRIPCAGGAYFRLTPYRIFRALANRCIRAGQPLIFYIHPWEWDTEMPRVATGVPTTVRHYAGTATVKRKLERLLGEFPFTSLAAMLEQRGVTSG